MICNATYNARHGDYSDVERICLKDFTDEICPLPIAADRVLTDEQLDAIREKMREEYSGEESICDTVNSLLAHIAFLSGVISDQRSDSVLYEQGKRDGVEGFLQQIKTDMEQNWTGTY